MRDDRCKRCRRVLPLEQFECTLKSGKVVVLPICNKCRTKRLDDENAGRIRVIEEGKVVGTIFLGNLGGKKRYIVYSHLDHRIYPLSRALMSGKLGRALTPYEVVHHKDRNTTNDSYENLEVLTRSDHRRLHIKENST